MLKIIGTVLDFLRTLLDLFPPGLHTDCQQCVQGMKASTCCLCFRENRLGSQTHCTPLSVPELRCLYPRVLVPNLEAQLSPGRLSHVIFVSIIPDLPLEPLILQSLCKCGGQEASRHERSFAECLSIIGLNASSLRLFCESPN